MIRHLLYSLVLALCLSGVAEAACAVSQASGDGSLAQALQKAQAGQCTESNPSRLALYRQYQPGLPSTSQVIRFTKSGTFSVGSMTISGGVILVADAAVRLSGGDVQITGRHVVLDGVAFDNTRVTLDGSENLFLAGGLRGGQLRLSGNDNVVAESEISDGQGVVIVGTCTSHTGAQLIKTQIHHHTGPGVFIQAGGAELKSNDIHHNAGNAIHSACASTVLSQNNVHHNSDGVVGTPLPSPLDLIAIETDTHYRVIGTIATSDEWLNLKTAIVEIFLADNSNDRQGSYYIASGTISNVAAREFQITIPRPVLAAGKEVPHPIFTATLTDPEHHITSAYAKPGNPSADWDDDGIPNTEELTTNPRLADSDGDGIKDGEEIQRHLNPTNPDTDGDGLKDGVELKTDPLNKDSDGDGLMDGEEDSIGTDPLNKDSDGDGLMDGSDRDRSSATNDDSDDDGVNDADEIRIYGSKPNDCDSDKDGLPDGVETDHVHPYATTPECTGLPTGGSNFAKISVLNPTKVDSDGDGLKDGEEDKNHNGWLDPNESDPTVDDTDQDGLSDYMEMRADGDNDHIADFNLMDLPSNPKCVPSIEDVDCDGLSNAQDTDSDNDGCSDKDEGFTDPNGIPAALSSETKRCGGGTGGSSMGASPSTPSLPSPSGGAKVEKTSPKYNAYWAERTDGGGNCHLNPAKTPDFSVFFLAAFLGLMLVATRFRSL